MQVITVVDEEGKIVEWDLKLNDGRKLILYLTLVTSAIVKYMGQSVG